ncbi:hypothetical protein VN12_08525 [Pirellula sp. SH-Sr6A]|nr:hypothetical protein VN12_08525 [Pirellula sp. SH-Sr6A]
MFSILHAEANLSQFFAIELSKLFEKKGSIFGLGGFVWRQRATSSNEPSVGDLVMRGSKCPLGHQLLSSATTPKRRVGVDCLDRFACGQGWQVRWQSLGQHCLARSGFAYVAFELGSAESPPSIEVSAHDA